MKYGIKTVDDFDVLGKTVLLRVDINQPVDKAANTLKDTTRIRGCIPTIKEISDKGAKLVLLAHQGSDIEYQNYWNLSPHARVISELVGKEIEFVPDVCGPYAVEKIKKLNSGEILLLDNVRFMAEEMTLFETKLNLTPEQMTGTQVVSRLSPLADMYICDAFAAAHRAQPTLVGFEQILPSAMGRLFEKEYEILSSLMDAPGRPCAFVLGGTKIQDAFMMMDKFLVEGIADKVLTGGLLGNIMMMAKGIDIGEPSADYIIKKNLGEYIEKAEQLISDYNNKLVLPVDVSYIRDDKRMTINTCDLPVDELFLDIGEKTAELFDGEIKKAKTVFVNGPMGVFEEELSEYGTKTVWQGLADSDAYTVVGGGDSVSATNKYGLADRIGFICTAGGALVRFLSGEELPAVKALKGSFKKRL